MADHIDNYTEEMADAEYHVPRIINTQHEAVKALKEVRSLAKKAYKAGNLALLSALHEAADPLHHLCATECYDSVITLSEHLKEADRATAEKDTHNLKEEADRIFDEILADANALEIELELGSQNEY